MVQILVMEQEQQKMLQNHLSLVRVLHFKTADDWFDYNDVFGVGNLKESFFQAYKLLEEIWVSWTL